MSMWRISENLSTENHQNLLEKIMIESPVCPAIAYEPMLAAALSYQSIKCKQCLLELQMLPTVRWGGTDR